MRYLFVGEKRSNRAISMNVTWESGRLCASHLFTAIKYCGVELNQCEFINIFEDFDINKISKFDGVIVGMGKKVQKELDNLKIKHIKIIHPAARGKIRIIENYCKHVKTQIKSWKS